MRTLSSSLLAAQKSSSQTPYVEVKASNKVFDTVNLKWNRIYEGTEDDFCHDAAALADGSLIRLRVSPLADGRKIYRQRVADPAAFEADFSQWSYIGVYNAVSIAAATLGSEISIIWIRSNSIIQRIKSTDYGITWGSVETISLSPITAINGISAAYKPNGDLALFYADLADVYVHKCLSGVWQTRQVWDKTAGEVSGISTVYDGDWNLLLSGKDALGGYKLWTCVYGDGGKVTAGTWTSLKIVAQAPSDACYTFKSAYLSKPGAFRAFYIEEYSGSKSYSRPFYTQTLAGADFEDNLWLEAKPFDLSSAYGMAITYYGSNCYLSTPFGVWHANSSEQTLDLSGDVLSIKTAQKGAKASAVIELDNSSGKYNQTSEGLPAPLKIGCCVSLSPGFVTQSGTEVSEGQSFVLTAYEYTRKESSSTLRIFAEGGHEALKNWRARCQFRWNKNSNECSVKEIISFILSRAGLSLEVISQSSEIGGAYPDFTISPSENGASLVEELLKLSSDVLFIEGTKAYLVNPSASDAPTYSYGTEHAFYGGIFGERGVNTNHIEVEGGNTAPVTINTYDFESISTLGSKFLRIENSNLSSEAEAQALGEAMLNKEQTSAKYGFIQTAVNCAHQPYDTISVTDKQLGLLNAKLRVLGIKLSLDKTKGIYKQTLEVCAP